MSAFTDAFNELLTCQIEATGETRTATVGAVTASAFVERLSYDEIVVAGGVAESKGYKLMMRVSDFATRPAKNATAVYGSLTLFVLEVTESNGVYEITIGDPA